MTLLDRINQTPPRPEEDAADAESAYRLTQLPSHPAEFVVTFANGDSETLRCDSGAITGFERWSHYPSPEIIHEIVRELRGACN